MSKLSYQDPCKSSSECDDTKMLICPTRDGECDCPNVSYANHCDCPSGYFWDNIDKKCCKYNSN